MHGFVAIPPLEAGAGMADGDHLAASGNQLDADIAVEIPLRRRGTPQMTTRFAVERDRPIQFLRKIPRGGLQLIEIADIAREGLPSSGLLAEGDSDDRWADVAIGVVEAFFLRRPQVLEDADDDIVIGGKCPGRQADAKDEEQGGDGRAIYHASLWDARSRNHRCARNAAGFAEAHVTKP
jgi:hypothetical protein